MAAKEAAGAASLPLMLAERTYNTSHPDFRNWMSGNFPSKLYTHSRIERALLNFPDNIPWDAYRRLVTTTRLRYVELGLLYYLDRLTSVPLRRPGNPLYGALAGRASFGRVDPAALAPALDGAWREVREDGTGAAEVFAAHAWMSDWIAARNAHGPGTYYTGWVNWDDAIFLYWAVRMAKPRVIVQTGVCNGLSSAFLTMALERNGGAGKLYAIDFPYIYDADDPALNLPLVYGVIIPDGKRPGWMVPEALRHRIELIEGKAEAELPPLLARLGDIDIFYHDSDHSYAHMTWEMAQVRPHLGDGGTMILDDVGWNAATWDFARQEKVPGYDYKGTLGVLFF